MVIKATLKVDLIGGLSKKVREKYSKKTYAIYFKAHDLADARVKWWYKLKSHGLGISQGFVGYVCIVL